MLKINGKFEDPFIINFNLFITTLHNDSKSHKGSGCQWWIPWWVPWVPRGT
jgi:hypothetical protein